MKSDPYGFFPPISFQATSWVDFSLHFSAETSWIFDRPFVWLIMIGRLTDILILNKNSSVTDGRGVNSRGESVSPMKLSGLFGK